MYTFTKISWVFFFLEPYPVYGPLPRNPGALSFLYCSQTRSILRGIPFCRHISCGRHLLPSCSRSLEGIICLKHINVFWLFPLFKSNDVVTRWPISVVAMYFFNWRAFIYLLVGTCAGFVFSVSLLSTEGGLTFSNWSPIYLAEERNYLNRIQLFHIQRAFFLYQKLIIGRWYFFWSD